MVIGFDVDTVIIGRHVVTVNIVESPDKGRTSGRSHMASAVETLIRKSKRQTGASIIHELSTGFGFTGETIRSYIIEIRHGCFDCRHRGNSVTSRSMCVDSAPDLKHRNQGTIIRLFLAQRLQIGIGQKIHRQLLFKRAGIRSHIKNNCHKFLSSIYL